MSTLNPDRKVSKTETAHHDGPMIRASTAQDICRKECAKILAVIYEWRRLKAEREFERRGRR